MASTPSSSLPSPAEQPWCVHPVNTDPQLCFSSWEGYLHLTCLLLPHKKPLKSCPPPAKRIDVWSESDPSPLIAVACTHTSPPRLPASTPPRHVHPGGCSFAIKVLLGTPCRHPQHKACGGGRADRARPPWASVSSPVTCRQKCPPLLPRALPFRVGHSKPLRCPSGKIGTTHRTAVCVQSFAY